MIALGINVNLLHDSGAAVVIDGKLTAAVNEERLTRIKQDRGFPRQSINEVLRICNLQPGNIDLISFVGYSPPEKIFAFFKLITRLLLFLKLDLFRIAFSRNRFQSVISRRLGPNSKEKINMFRNAWQDWRRTRTWLSDFRKKGFKGKIIHVPHHLCHLYAAYYSSGFTGALVINIEGTSFGYTTNIFLGEKGKLREIMSTPDPHSAGHFYAGVTEMLGFRPGYHEGKVTGLSAWGREESKTSGKLDELIRKMFWFDKGQLHISPAVFTYPYYYNSLHELPPDLLGFSREEIAWAAQKRLEEVICELVRWAIKETKISKVILTGGVSANVRMNQTIASLPEVSEIYIYPGMGDFGNAHGAALKPFVDKGMKPKHLSSLYLGPEFSPKEIKDALRKYRLEGKQIISGLAEKISRELSSGKIVCLFQGRMEYGPRALGNRSILAGATDEKVNQRLNNALKRSEFMPFAPVILSEEAKRCLLNLKKTPLALDFMTITCQCKDFLKEHCPAIVHVDNTARPQLIKREQNILYYDILKQYFLLTGIPVLINTSFNMHDEPIVCSPEDAVRSFLSSGLDILIMENFWIEK